MTRRHRRITQRMVLTGFGLTGIGAEAFYYLHLHEPPDLTLTAVFTGMLGFQAYLPWEIKRRGDDDEAAPKRKDDDEVEGKPHG